MPNMFAPRAMQRMVKERAEQLRMDTEGDIVDIKEWHGHLDMLDDEATAQFLEMYSRSDDLPAVISGVEHADEGE